MAWYTGKTDIVGIALGDSNMVGVGGFELGVQTLNVNVRCYATTAVEPYDPAELQWRTLDPDGTSRYDQMYDTLLANETYIGQVLGGNGAAAMQMASTIQAGTGCDTFWLYQGAQGGTTADDWANGDNWDTMLAELPAALAAIPGSPTYADVIFISLGVNDFLGTNSQERRYSSDEFYTNFKALRSQMMDEGWWVRGTTQIVMLDLPRNGIMYEPWYGLDYVMSRTNDRIWLTNSLGATFKDEVIPVHYTPASLTAMGAAAGAAVISQIPKQQSTLSIGGTRVSIGGTKIRAHGA